MIEVKDIRKTFRVPVAKTGRFAAVRSLLSRERKLMEAVKGISFTVFCFVDNRHCSRKAEWKTFGHHISPAWVLPNAFQAK
ncbi:hypothetical protein [Paenibacillus sp. GYB003]|uniref:hypothetical protein n=1 Tax=Paenibacillus sp. GYB003 TaxID=2994392 RepID=UPI002F960A9D